MIKHFRKENLQTLSGGYTFESAVIEIGRVKGFYAESLITSIGATAGAFTAAASDICTKAAHGILLGTKVQLTTTVTLPGGLALLTDYYVIPLSVNTFSLASSLANAILGTAIDITDAGTGVHTITGVALAGCTVKLQAAARNVAAAFVDVENSSKSATAVGSQSWNYTNPHFSFLKIVYTFTAGQLAVSQIVDRREY